MMTRLFLALFWALLCLSCSPAASPPPREGFVAEASESASHPVFMWRTSSATSVVHLLGSIHVGSPDMYPLDDRIEEAFQQSETLVLEIDLDEEAQAEAALAFVQMALLPKGESLDALLDEETRDLLHQRLDELGIPYKNVEMFRPWFVGLTIGMKETEAQGYTGEYGIDQHFRNQAVGKKEILELESVQEQAALFASLSQDAEVDDLRMTLLGEGEQDMLTELKDEWLLGKTTRIESEVEQTRKDYPEAYEALYANRNRNMTKKVEGYLKTTKSYFVVAGAAHMVGEEGIVTLLRNRGYTVEQL